MTSSLDFLGKRFAPFALEQRAELAPALERNPQRLSGYTFATLWAWRSVYGYAWARYDERTLLLACVPPSEGRLHLIQPIGAFDDAACAWLVEAAAALPYPLKIGAVTHDFLAAHPCLAKHFEAAEDPLTANYVYRAHDLAELAGSRYAKKRNLIAQAARTYAWTVEALTSDNLDACHDVLAQVEAPAEDPAGFFAADTHALVETLSRFAALAQRGVLVRVDGTPAGFAIYEDVGHDTAAVHFERARRDYKGMYQIVNRETARRLEAEGFAFVNREEDLGDLGLRQAKRSYHPSHLVPAALLTYVGRHQ